MMHEPQHNKACLPLNNEDYLPIDDEFDSTSDSDAESLFDSSDNEAKTSSDTDSENLLEEVDGNADDDNEFVSCTWIVWCREETLGMIGLVYLHNFDVLVSTASPAMRSS
jgi:hypothetical protein